MIDLAVLILSIGGFIVMAGGLVLITYIAYKTLK
tara:strand:+ start:4483 stop:4584 length:102 start_codon:yes stop_codon:yes gene_type:complete